MKRLNVKLLVILFVGVVVLSGAAFGLWVMNSSRTRDALKIEAQRFEKEGELDEALKYYGRYLRQVPDDAEAAGQYAMLLADWSEGPNAPRSANQLAFKELEKALRLDSSRDDIRRRLIKYTMARRRIADAVQHINVLLEKYPEDGELYARLAQCHVTQNRLEEAREAFDKSIENDPTRVDSYFAYAVLLRSKLDLSEESDAMIDLMVENNPENFRSYLVRSNYLQAYGMLEESWEDIQEAVERAPEEMDVLLGAANLARRTKRVDEARELLMKALEVDGENQQVFRLLATLAHEAKDSKLAMKYVNEGLEKIPDSRVLLEMKAGLHIEADELDEAKLAIAELDGLRYDIEKLDFLRAQLLLREGQFVRAGQLLESIRPLLVRDPSSRVRTNLTLITCYQKLGQVDLVIDACRRVLEDDPQNAFARSRRVSAYMQNQRFPEASQEAAEGGRSMAPASFQAMLGIQLALPKEEQDWTAAEEYIAQIRKRTEALEDEEIRSRQNVNLMLYEAEILFHKGQFAESEQRLNAALEALPEDPSMWVALANFKQRSEGLDALFEVLDRAEAELGQHRILTLKRIQGFQAMPPEDAIAELKGMESAIKEQYSDEEELFLLSNLAEAFFAKGNYEEAKRIFRFVDENAPYDDLKIRMRRFAMAATATDDEGMLEAIDRIAEVVGKESAEWNYAQAARIIKLIEKAKMENDQLAKAREYIEKAFETRPNWHVVWRVRAQIDRQEGNYESAIENYERAIELGERKRGYYMDLVRLYSITRQPEKALKYLELLRNAIPDSAQLAKGEMVIRMQSGDVKGAFEAAKQVVPNSEDAGDWVQFGQILAKLKAEDETFEYEITAEEALRKATELSPADGSIWSTLVQYLVAVDKTEEAEKVIDEMQGHLPDEQEPLVMGMCYQMVGRGEDAEKSYLRAVSDRPENLGILRTLVSFYIQNSNLPVAVEYLDKMLALADQNVANSQNNLRWARRSKAQIVARSGNYGDLQDALAMIDANAVDGVLPRVEVVLKATMLGTRPDYDSRSEAIRLLEDLQIRAQGQGSDLSPGEKHLLAQLYASDYKPDSWLKCREQMLDLLASAPDSQTYKFEFIRMLTKRAEGPNDLAEVKSWLDSLDRQGEGDMLTESRVRYLVKAGKPEEAVEVMNLAVPVVADILPEEVQRLLGAATVMETLELYDAAEEFFKRYVNVKSEERLRLAGFYGRRLRLDDALFVCEEALEDQSYTEVCNVAQGVLRSCVAQVEIGDKHFKRVEGWIKKAMEENIDPDGVKVTYADFRDAQGQYDAAVKLYEELLNDEDITDRARVTALNNVAFIYAVRDGNGKRAQPLIDEAMGILGPLPELLDTKAMVLLAMGDTEQSISLLNSALQTSPDDSMLYFHKAKALKTADDMDGFFESMERAVSKGLNESKLPVLEHDSYRDLLKTFELIRAA